MEARKKTPSAERVYEVIEPTMEWETEATADTIKIYLPGFRKEQLKVQVTTNRFLRISGERQVSDNKWSHFRKEIQIASNYDTNEISAKFEKGVLLIKHPKIIVQHPEPPQEKSQQQALTEASKPRQEKAQKPPKEAPKTPQQKPLPPAKPPQKLPLEEQQPVPKSSQKPAAAPVQNSQPLQQEIESLMPEKPTSETQDKGPSKTGTNRHKNGKINRREDSSNALQKMMEKEKELSGNEQKDKSKEILSSTDAGNAVTGTSTSTIKQENVKETVHQDPGKLIDRDKATTEISSKLETENYNQVFRDAVTDLKNPRKLMSSILVALKLMVIGLYFMILKAIRSLRKSDK